METLVLYGEDGSPHRAFVHQEHIAAIFDGRCRLDTGNEDNPLAGWDSAELRGRQHI